MEGSFWKQAWVDRRIGFHQSEYNAPMSEHYKDLDLTNKTVLIPLAGKSKDILYFLERGAKVIAIELSEMACEEFFKENSLSNIEKTNNSSFTIYANESLTYYCGDFFEISKRELGHIDFYFDRACIVALPMDMRSNYYKKIETLLDKHTDIFILTLSHDGPLDFGPPFLVPTQEIIDSYKSMGFDLIYRKYDSSKPRQKFKDIGVTKMSRLIWKRNI